MEFDTGESRKRHFEHVSSARLAEGVRLVSGNTGDHALLHALLRTAQQAPSYEDFQAWLEEPSYEPNDRLLVKRESQLLAHIHTLHRQAWFHGVKLPVGGVQDLAVLPEFREAGYEHLLLRAAERLLRDRQAIVALARTDQPALLRNYGWSAALEQGPTQANVHDILVRLSSAPSPLPRRSRSLRIRLWRHVELDALRAVYRHAAVSSWGTLDRSEPYWRWLVGRKAHDELIVAIHGRDDWESLDRPSRIAGYAMTRGSQVVELFTLRGFARAAPLLLTRACQDAIERDLRSLSLHVSATDPLHDLMLSAGGSRSAAGRNGGTLMIKLLDPARWIEYMGAVLVERAEAAGIALPCQFVFDTQRRRYRLELARDSSSLVRDAVTTVDVTCTSDAFGALLVGNLEIATARQAGQLKIREDATAVRLAALFPPTAFWLSQFDARGI